MLTVEIPASQSDIEPNSDVRLLNSPSLALQSNERMG